jgi:hypothetical protein
VGVDRDRVGILEAKAASHEIRPIRVGTDRDHALICRWFFVGECHLASVPAQPGTKRLLTRSPKERVVTLPKPCPSNGGCGTGGDYEMVGTHQVGYADLMTRRSAEPSGTPTTASLRAGSKRGSRGVGCRS